MSNRGLPTLSLVGQTGVLQGKGTAPIDQERVRENIQRLYGSFLQRDEPQNGAKQELLYSSASNKEATEPLNDIPLNSHAQRAAVNSTLPPVTASGTHIGGKENSSSEFRNLYTNSTKSSGRTELGKDLTSVNCPLDLATAHPTRDEIAQNMQGSRRMMRRQRSKFAVGNPIARTRGRVRPRSSKVWAVEKLANPEVAADGSLFFTAHWTPSKIGWHDIATKSLSEEAMRLVREEMGDAAVTKYFSSEEK